MKKNIYLFVFLYAILSSFTGFAQNSVNISGTITDEKTKEPVVGATVVVGKQAAMSDKNGFYELINVDAKSKKIKVSMLGFVPKTETLNLVAGKNLTLNFMLEENDVELDEFVITGTRTRKSIDNSPVLTKVVSDAEIKEIGAVTAFDALELVMPGVQFSPDAHGDNIQVQGLDNKYVLVLLDGERLASETRGNVNFNRINAADIKRIEIINGSSSVLYGSNAMGAIINIITKDAKKRLEGSVGSRYSNFNTLNSNFTVGTHTDKFSLLVNGFRNSSDGYILNTDTIYTEQDTVTPITVIAQGYTDYSGGLKTEYKINKKIKIKVHGNYYRHENILPKNTLKKIHTKNDNITGGANFMATFSDKHSLNLNVNTDLYRGYKVYENKNDSTGKYADYQFATALLSDVYSFCPKLEMVTGAELNMERIFSAMFFGADIDEAQKIKRSADINSFLQLDYQVLKDLEIVGGVRYTYHSSFGNHFTPKISVMYKLDRFKFRAGASKGYKSPTLKELHYNFDHQGMFWIYGNPNLKPENANYMSFSTEYTRNGFVFSVNVYRNSIKNKIESISSINQANNKMELHYKNVSEALIKGVESYVNYNLSFLKIRLGYAFTDAKDVSTDLSLYGNSRHTGNASLTWKVAKIKFPFSLTLSGRAASPRLYQTATDIVNPATGETTTEVEKRESNPYTLWNVAFNQNFKIYNNFSLDLQLGVHNIFGYSELLNSAVVNPGRTFYGGLTFYF